MFWRSISNHFREEPRFIKLEGTEEQESDENNKRWKNLVYIKLGITSVRLRRRSSGTSKAVVAITVSPIAFTPLSTLPRFGERSKKLESHKPTHMTPNATVMMTSTMRSGLIFLKISLNICKHSTVCLIEQSSFMPHEKPQQLNCDCTLANLCSSDVNGLNGALQSVSWNGLK